MILLLGGVACVALPAILAFLLGRAGFQLNRLWLVLWLVYFIVVWFGFQQIGRRLGPPPKEILPEPERLGRLRKLFWRWGVVFTILVILGGILGYLRGGLPGLIVFLVLAGLVLLPKYFRYRKSTYWPWPTKES